MFSTRCTYCHQLINLKTDEVRDAIADAESKHDNLYTMHCPRCRKLLKVQVKDLKRKLPMDLVLPTPVTAHEEAQEQEHHEEPEAQPEPEPEAPVKPARKSRAKKSE